MSEQNPPKIEFPCPDYPVKVIGENYPEFAADMSKIISEHCSDFDPSKVETQLSSNGRFASLRVRITATSEEQLSSLHEALRATGKVHIVL